MQKISTKAVIIQLPLDSKKIENYLVKDIEREHHVADIKNVVGKYALLPKRDGYAALPVIHTL